MQETTTTIAFPGGLEVTFSTEPELKLGLIRNDFPDGLPPGEGPFDIV